MRAMTNGALSRFNPAQPGAQGMKVVATGLLVAMAAVFAVARALEPHYPWLGYVNAFAEAAMVGGLADWFAVTALFRHPLGLPIPHTAIIPRNKDRIGDALANFLRENFLIPSVVARRMRSIDVAGAAGRFLADARRRRHAHPRRRVAADRRHVRKPRRRAARRHRQGRDLVAAAHDGGLAAARPRARLGDQRGPPRADARGGDPLDGARARRERAADPRDGPQEGELGAEARRARRQARRRDHRRPAAS